MLLLFVLLVTTAVFLSWFMSPMASRQVPLAIANWCVERWFEAAGAIAQHDANAVARRCNYVVTSIAIYNLRGLFAIHRSQHQMVILRSHGKLLLR
jgi:hypothetical protein